MKNREDQVSLSQDKIKAVNEQLEISEQKLLDFASIPDIEDQLKDRMEVINLTIIVFFAHFFYLRLKVTEFRNVLLVSLKDFCPSL